MATPKKTVLITEDEKPLAHALQLKLEHEGFAVTMAGNGRECVDLVSKQAFDVVLLDLMMPEMDGFQVLEQLQKNGSTASVFVLSNLSQHEDEARVLGLGAKKFFIKSNTPLTTIVEEVKNA